MLPHLRPSQVVTSQRSDKVGIKCPTCLCSGQSIDLFNLVELVTRHAVSEDAIFLWRLLFPSLRPESNAPENVCHPSVHGIETPPISSSPIFTEPQRTDVSLLWEVDITFLFIALLHLRPGLDAMVSGVECQRRRQLHTFLNTDYRRTAFGSRSASCSSSSSSGHTSVDNIASDEANMTSTRLNGLSSGDQNHWVDALVCDNRRPRFPTGDAHEAYLMRICYTACLTQALLSWQPNSFSDTQNKEQVSTTETLLEDEFDNFHIPDSDPASLIGLVSREEFELEADANGWMTPRVSHNSVSYAYCIYEIFTSCIPTKFTGIFYCLP
ncbi:unnamed protein product [Protopolystoma xenopodis]|uniref:Uncharacterized protein n=1 Tax=Protopolystoma xenopodis TaxID=117903 RepID=A0A3S5ALE9_9PLAT|nr:unnamed protein product [Protopolystoma xenopodis]